MLHVLVTSNHTFILLLLSYCNFATVMTDNINMIYRISDMWPQKGVVIYRLKTAALSQLNGWNLNTNMLSMQYAHIYLYSIFTYICCCPMWHVSYYINQHYKSLQTSVFPKLGLTVCLPCPAYFYFYLVLQFFGKCIQFSI